jgi:hypothetical protein
MKFDKSKGTDRYRERDRITLQRFRKLKTKICYRNIGDRKVESFRTRYCIYKKSAIGDFRNCILERNWDKIKVV